MKNNMTTTTRTIDDSNNNDKIEVDDQLEFDDDIPLTICLAINYGGRADILRAATEYAQSIIDASSTVTATTTTTTTLNQQPKDDTSRSSSSTIINIDENEISKRLCTSDIPNVDLIIRTGGERRLSNFFLWESAYAELYFCDTLWPDFDDVALNEALSWYSKRERRFGGR